MTARDQYKRSALVDEMGGDWTLEARSAPPPDAAGQGRAPTLDFDAWSSGAGRPPLAPVDVAGVRTYRDRLAPAYIELRARDVGRVIRGRSVSRDDMVALGPASPGGPDLVLVELRSGGRVLVLDDGEASVWRDIADDFALDEPALSALPAPPVGDWLGGRGPEWLLDHALALAASPGAVDRAEACGVVMRYAPADHEGTSAFEAARGWCRAQLAGSVAVVEGACVDRALTLADGLAASLATRPLARASLPAIVGERDDLQSAWAALRVAGGGAGLRAALQGVDERAALQATAIDDAWDVLEAPLTHRLDELSWREPECWWASRP